MNQGIPETVRGFPAPSCPMEAGNPSPTPHTCTHTTLPPFLTFVVSRQLCVRVFQWPGGCWRAGQPSPGTQMALSAHWLSGRRPRLGVGEGNLEGQRQPPHRSFSYMDSYNGDIRFDNIYISTYFCQIDEHRKMLVRGHSPARGCLAGCPVWLPSPEGQRRKGREPLLLVARTFLSRAKGLCCHSAKLRKKRSSSPLSPLSRPQK